MLIFALGLALIGAIIYLAIKFFLYRLIAKLTKSRSRKIKKLGERLKKPVKSRVGCQILLVSVMVVCAVGFISVTAHGLSAPRGLKHVYHQTELATQADISVLFSFEPDDDVGKESEVLSRLHIPTGFVGTQISQEMFDYYEDLFSGIYINGTKTGPDGKTLSTWQGVAGSNYAMMNNEYIEEANEWRDKYVLSNQLACLYQHGKALNDAGMEMQEISFGVLLEIAADAISCEEEFLSYSDRNISGDDLQVINVEYITLMNGKLYLHLAIRAEAEGGEDRNYANCLWVAAYQCIAQGREQIDMQNVWYAELSYYLGNIGERILKRMTAEEYPSLYMILGRETVENYQTALELMESNPGYYRAEENMEKNARAGISTLNGLGFFSEKDNSP